jgi:ribosome-binding factor A
MKPRHGRSQRQAALQGPSQRQLRAGELVRHALAEVLRVEELQDETMAGVSITVTEVRLSPDLRHASVFVIPLGGAHAPEVVDALNRHARFLRGRLGHGIELKFTPELKFLNDQSFEAAERMARLFDNPRIREDLMKEDPQDGDSEAGGPKGGKPRGA